LSSPYRKLQRKILRNLARHLKELGIEKHVSVDSGKANSWADKGAIRASYKHLRRDKLSAAAGFLASRYADLERHFADGNEIVPAAIEPEIEVVLSGTEQADLFRLACLTWSIPVSEGFGRRIRCLVWDRHANKLMGLFALGDPVFNLGVRDRYVEWAASDRRAKLVDVMDAYVLGSVMPYSRLLCGKLVACLLRTREVRDAFREKYHASRGIISRKRKRPELVMITTTSALGRSSVYNRLRLGGTKYLKSVGYTSGFGHFHVPDELFADIRELLRRRAHPYAEGNRFGQGPNWKFRAIRAALELSGVDRDLLRHGICREVFCAELASNAREILRGEQTVPNYRGLLSVRRVSLLARERWVVRRAETCLDFRSWKKTNLRRLVSEV